MSRPKEHSRDSGASNQKDAIVFSRYCVVTLLRIFCRYSNLVSLEWDQSEADGRLMPEEE